MLLVQGLSTISCCVTHGKVPRYSTIEIFFESEKERAITIVLWPRKTKNRIFNFSQIVVNVGKIFKALVREVGLVKISPEINVYMCGQISVRLIF